MPTRKDSVQEDPKVARLEDKVAKRQQQLNKAKNKLRKAQGKRSSNGKAS